MSFLFSFGSYPFVDLSSSDDGRGRVFSLGRESESSVSGDGFRCDLFDLDLVVDGRFHLMPFCCRRDGRIRLAGAGAILLLTEVNELDVTMTDGVCLADLVARARAATHPSP